MADPVSAGIAAGGQLAGAGISAAGNKAAAKSAERSNAAALEFAKQQQAQRQANYGGADKQYTQRLNDWNAARQALLLQRYGVDISLGSPVSGAAPAPMAGVAPRNIGAILQDKQTGQPAPDAAQGAPPPDLQNWNDWSRYGLGGPRQQA